MGAGRRHRLLELEQKNVVLCLLVATQEESRNRRTRLTRNHQRPQ
jgi:hypothetical protein